ncbi:MAG: 30S ribosomal protein S1 [Legionellales bacterium]|nr:30S ribosomal protein S1 [Legionellales bacterium]
MSESESFERLFKESLSKKVIIPGFSVLTGTVVGIGKDFITVEAGLKSEGVIAIEQFYNEKGEIEVALGDEVDVVLETFEDGFGETRLSREKAKRFEAWNKLMKAYEGAQSVLGTISGKVKGGFTVELENIRAFLPGSLVDVRPVRDTAYLEGKELEFKIIKMDSKRNNVVVSRRAVLESENSSEREQLLTSLEEGKELKGIVKNLTDYGAFIDLGGIDGLLHITDMSWKRIKHPSELIAVGDEINVVVLKFDRERSRVSLGMKQLGDDPWANIKRRYPPSTRLFGKVTNIADYGCFIELEDGVEGLVHVSEMSWTNKNIHPSKVVQLGDEVEVIVLEIDEERRRISLGIKQCVDNPWDNFAKHHNKNDVVTGKIKSITDFGIFIGLEGGIDGLVHLNDISWTETGEEAIRKFKKGDEVTALVLAVDSERERISLGIKQMEQDSFTSYTETNTKSAIVKGKVIELDSKGVTVELADGVTGFIKLADLSREKVKDAEEIVKVDDEIEAKIINIDRKNRTINLSVKAKDTQEEADTLRQINAQDSAVNTTLGDLLKEQIHGRDNENN